MDADGQPSSPDPVEGRSYAYWASWLGTDSRPPTDDPLAVARQGTSLDKRRLAVEKHLNDEVVDLLLHSGDTDVAASLARNTTVSTDTLQRLAELHPEHRHMTGRHPEAPVQLKEAVPIGDHINYALLRYYEQRGATDDVRRAIHQRYRTSPQPGGPLLGDVWREVEAETSQ